MIISPHEVQAMVHSVKEVQTVLLHEKVKDNDYICTTKSGVKCHAIFNVFTGLYYADDLYAVIEEKEVK